MVDQGTQHLELSGQLHCSLWQNCKLTAVLYCCVLYCWSMHIYWGCYSQLTMLFHTFLSL